MVYFVAGFCRLAWVASAYADAAVANIDCCAEEAVIAIGRVVHLLANAGDTGPVGARLSIVGAIRSRQATHARPG